MVNVITWRALCISQQGLSSEESTFDRKTPSREKRWISSQVILFLQSSKTVESKFETLLEAHSVKGCWFNSGGFQKLKKLKFSGKFYFIFLACEEGEHKGETVVFFLAENIISEPSFDSSDLFPHAHEPNASQVLKNPNMRQLIIRRMQIFLFYWPYSRLQ